MKKYILIILFILYGTVFAKEKSPKEILLSVRDNYSSIASIKSEFKQTFYWTLAEQTHEYMVTVYMKKGNKFRIEMPGQVLVSDGALLKTLNEKNKQLLIDEANRNNPANPFFVDLVDGYLKNYDIINAEKGKDDLWSISLKAKDEQQVDVSIDLVVDEKEQLIRKMKKIDINDNITTFEIQKVDTETKLNDSLFELQTPHGYEVVDLR